MQLKPGYLPSEVARRLKAAREIDPHLPPGESLKRTLAMDQVMAKAREDYPHLFKREPMKININNLRVAFPAFFEAQAIEGGEPKFGGKFVIPPDHPAVKQLEDGMLAVAREKWTTKADAIYAKLVKTGKPKNIEVCFVREPYCNGDGDAYAGFEDSFYLSANSAVRPLIIDRDKTPLVAADGRPYAGCYVNVQVELWAQDNKWGKGIRAQLKGVQFYKDGDAFSGGAPASADDFADLGDGSDAEDLV